MRPEAMALASERISAKLIDFYAREVAVLALSDEEGAAVFGMAATAVTMSLLVAGGVAPADAAARVSTTARGVAEDLA